jgi:dihydroorotase-like cyclic amidohydrolase
MSDLVIKGATILDPSTGINEKKDLSVSRGKIEEVSNSISEGSALKVIDAFGMILPQALSISTRMSQTK